MYGAYNRKRAAARTLAAMWSLVLGERMACPPPAWRARGPLTGGSRIMRIHRIIAVLGGAAALMLAAGPAGAQAEQETQHFSFEFSEPSVNLCIPSITGVLSVQGDGFFHLTDTGQTFQLTNTVQGTFTFEPDDPSELSSTGHFVVQHRENLNYGQLQDLRVTDTTLLVALLEDGTHTPIEIMTTLLISADGSVEVKVDSVRCGGQIVQ